MSFNDQQIQNHLKALNRKWNYLLTRRTCSTASVADVGADAAVHFTEKNNNNTSKSFYVDTQHFTFSVTQHCQQISLSSGALTFMQK